MTQCNSLNVKFSNSQINKLKLIGTHWKLCGDNVTYFDSVGVEYIL